MEIAKVSVSGVAATTVEATTIPAGIIGATIAVEYGPEWGGMIKNVSFRGAEDVTVVNVGNVVKLPQEVAAKPNMYIQIGFTGVSGDGTVLIPTLWAYLGTTKPASPVNVEGGSAPPVWAQVVAMIGDLNQLNTPSQDNLVNAINDAAKSGNGNVDLSGCVKSVNGVKPDADGNVEVKVSSDSGQNPTDKLVLKSPNGTVWNITVSDNGVITATTQTSGGDSGGSEDAPTTLETYTIFVPENVSDEWKVTSVGALDMPTAEFLELFYDGFVSAPPSGVTVTKNSIGKDESGQYDMWEYDFKPANYSRTILLSSGMHTYELSASFGLANFIGHLYTDTDNDAFDYIRNNVRVKVIPVVNPWGFNQYPKKYGNINGVNPNRNFDLNGEWSAYNGNTNEWNQKGVAPFSEAEVVNLARWVEANWNAEFWIDCHTGEGYSDKDLWVYYSSDSAILDRINGGISAIETWFKETYGLDCVTTRTIDNPDSIRMHWSEKIAGVPGMTLEQAPQRTTFGTAAMNEAADISNYSTNISTFVQEFLLEKYRDDNVVAVESVSLTDVTMGLYDLSTTITASVTPGNTTQNKFKWESSNENVVMVYGCTNKAVLVNVGSGTSVISCTNLHNNSVVAQCNVTVESAEDTGERLGAQIGANATSKTGAIDVLVTTKTNRLITNKVEATPGETLVVSSEDGYYIKVFGYTADGVVHNASGICGNLSTDSASGTIPDDCAYYRILFKKSDNSDFTVTELAAASVIINGVSYSLYENAEEIEPSSTVVLPMTIGSLGTDGAESSAANRARSDYFAVDLSTDTALHFEGLDHNIVLRVYDAEKTFLDSVMGVLHFVPPESANLGWIKAEGVIYAIANAAYARLVIKNADDSDITTPISGSVIIGDIRYTLTSAT